MTKPLGRPPRRKVSEDEVAQLAFDGCSLQDMSDLLGVSREYLEKHYHKLVRRKRAERRHELLCSQRGESLKGSAALLIWRGKNELGQTDKVDVTSGGETLIVEFRRIVEADASETKKTT